jgi:hypothetical protein
MISLHRCPRRKPLLGGLRGCYGQKTDVMEVGLEILPLSIAAAAVATMSATVLLWPITIKPALRRRYEREHQRRKTRADRRNKS